MKTTGLISRIAGMALYALGAWLALAALLYAIDWAPEDILAQSGRIIALVTASIALLTCVIAATAQLMSASAAAVPDPQPRR